MPGTMDVAAAMQRARAVFERRPEAGLHDDAGATASWCGGTRVVARHANGSQVATDMPSELGGSGDHVTPGWLFRAGIASCTVTTIAMVAAAEAIELTELDVSVSSRSNARGLLGLSEADGRPVYAGPHELRLQVRIGAANASVERLRALVERSLARSPMGNAIERSTPLQVQIDTV